ncbi:MAG: flavodoxin [Acidimicrobiia bacterium]
MQAVVIYESMFGNTREIAERVAEALAPRLDVTVEEVGHAPRSLDEDVGLVVLGGPTRALGSTRRSAGTSSATDPLASLGTGLRGWLDGFVAAGVPRFATFDTRLDRPRLPGSAAEAAAARLCELGFGLVAEPETFWVRNTVGPLCPDEADRARQWGDSLARTATLPADDATVGAR